MHAAMALSFTRVFSFLCLCHLFLLLWLCLLSFLKISIDAHTDDAVDAKGAANDVRALIQFKKFITSDPLSLLQNWDAAAPNACNWTGITCSTKHSGRVVNIYLNNATLRGSLSPHLSNLSFLHGLHIYNNSFSGTIPPSLGTLHRLKMLNLCMNEFEGKIPFQLGNLSSLQFLYLCENSLSGEIPESLARLQDLKELTVFENHLSGHIPSSLGELRRLEFLELGVNNIHGAIPAQLGNLSSSFMTILGLGSNHLTGLIPDSFARLYRLTHLYLERNNFAETIIPPCLRNLTALAHLSLNALNLQGRLPAWMGNLHKLQYLGLFENRFFGNIPNSWQNLSELQNLQLSNNRLSGTPPSWLGTLCSQLTILNIGSNYFTSGVSMNTQPIPILRAISNCSLLISLAIYDNHLTGTLPLNFGGSLPNLQRLSLWGNFISGNIPQSIANLSSLFSLALSQNVFNGNIPQIANFKSLQYMDLSKNKLQGSIPTELSLLNQSLAYLRLSGNKLSGSIPANIGKLVNLRQLYLDGNMLSGKIPPEIGNCLILEDLVLSSNNLSGPIPPQVAGFKSIVFHFDLSANALTGEVPPEIAGLQMAQFINLSSNHLCGNIASYMDSWLDAREINLTFNNFSGNLSKSIGNIITQLRSMDLSDNNFTGPVPASLLNHSTLKFLNFSYNSFDGEVPCLSSFLKKFRLTRLSFLGNPNLCGRCFGLKACAVSPVQHSSHFNKSTVLKIVLPIIGLLLLLVVAGILFIFKPSKTFKGETPRIGEKFLKISEEELRRATDNFSPSNLVGEGSHGKVYRGVLTSRMVVAVKCFPSTNQIGALKSFKKECGALRKVRHRNILKIITVVWSEEIKALVMPFMSNGNLHSLLHSRQDGQLIPLDLQMRVKILTELAQGLGYLHHDCEFQVNHCDIKPENVLLDDDMTVKLSDFGISCLTGDFDCPTASSSLAVKGSVGYIAPEYGIGERICPKGDVYSFGVVTLEVMTRLKPTHEMFSGDVTLPLWISMALKGKLAQERRETIKDIVKIADEGGGGIDMDKDDELSAMETILMLGLRCTCYTASMRPSMKVVESFLQSVAFLNPQGQRILPKNLEEVISMVELQPSLNHRWEKAESSTFSS